MPNGPDEPDRSSRADYPVFDDEFIAGGVEEASLRRLATPPPRPTAPPPSEPYRFGRPGPRDWTPSGPSEPVWREPRRRGRWIGLGVGVAVVATWIALSTTGHGGTGTAFLAPTPQITPAHAPIRPSPGGPTTTSSGGAQVNGLTASTTRGTCFDLAGQVVHTKSCGVTHTYELVAIEAASGDDNHYPNDGYWWGPVASQCERDLGDYTRLSSNRWPPGLVAWDFVPTPSGWSRGDRTVYCLAKSVPPTRRSVARIPPTLPPSVSGTLVVLKQADSACLVLRGASGVPLVIESLTGAYVTDVFLVNGAPDDAKSGIYKTANPASTAPATLVRHAGQQLTLTGRYLTSGELRTYDETCGLTRGFAYTTVR